MLLSQVRRVFSGWGSVVGSQLTSAVLRSTRLAATGRRVVRSKHWYGIGSLRVVCAESIRSADHPKERLSRRIDMVKVDQKRNVVSL